MKKCLKMIILIVCLLPITLLFSACSDNGSSDDSLNKFENITFVDKQVVYDGQEHEIIVTGDLPNGANVVYTNNKATNAGVYNAEATISMEGYDTLNLSAKLTINKATYDMTNVRWNYSSPFVYDGLEKQVIVEGLPTGVTVREYVNNVKTDIGTYTTSVVFNYDTLNYNAISLAPCVWEIIENIDLSNVASNILTAIMKVPDAWEFLPENFQIENKVYTGNTDLNFDNFVTVESIPQIAMGKQMNMVYSTLLDVDEALNYLRYVYGSLNVIVGAYQTFINNNPDNYVAYEHTTDNFTFKIVLEESNYQMLIDYNSASIELLYERESKKCYGRIQLANLFTVKYEVAEDELTVAVSVAEMSLTKLHFERDEGVVKGYLYEYLGTSETNIKTSALIKIDDEYTLIISNKSHNEDNVVTTGDVEIYSNATANLIGEEVRGTNSLKDFQTSWFNLYDVTNLNSVKVVDKTNGLNRYTVYINGSANKIEETRTLMGTGSRKFYITMRTMYVYTYNQDSEKYEKEEISIPMLAVQNDYIKTFSSDFYSANKSNGAVEPTNISLNAQDKAFMLGQYEVLIDEYLQIKEDVTYQSIVDFVGNQNEYFN